ncbi:hypothetical protein PISMIDRAFT_682070 [Pisolithus microcarpus 441]|uniref:Heterokaryon incompatibility domain-containing protein n=1 Tax=Pisolithus microcarpus 441 TaxID=765257 RepID=A0A0C9Z375_9AGAM|nr:heterokaryon incompatibility protein-domain-containing protein [Pisolithus microcarpus]KIK20669.1 hypothetical protein PISMIDRAFT_682070 [Pisolithus microcarpus 441]
MRLIDVGVFLERERQIEEEGTVDRDMKTVLKVLHDLDTNYAILSHRWADEVDYLDIMELAKMENRDEIRERSGYRKIVKGCQQAENDGLEWLWVDTCCIDKRNSTELSEALNSMFRWYENSKRCYAYLHDVDIFSTTPDHETFAKFNGWPEWFSRGWTLQELIAPEDLQFFNKEWQFIGDKRSRACNLEEITRVPRGVLEDSLAAYGPSVAQVMSWAADRETAREEDRAYSLMGLLDVNMPMLYGEEKKAFWRLQQEIIRKSTDQTIFAWVPTDETSQPGCPVLADDPSLFRECHDIVQIDSKEFYSKLSDLWGAPDNSEDTGILRRRNHFFRRFFIPQQWSVQNQAFRPFTVTNMGVQVQLPVRRYCGYPLILQVALACKREGGPKPIIINLVPWRTRCYRYTGQVKRNLTLTPYRHSQVILAYEGSGPSSGIVIEEVDGVVASLLDQCAARVGINVGNNDVDEHRLGVTCAEIHHIPDRWLQIFTSVIASRRSIFHFVLHTALYCVIAATMGVVPFFTTATISIAIVWILSEAYAEIPFIRLCTSECSSRGEYIIGSGMEIIVLRGSRPAVSSITHGETRIPSHVVHDVRILVRFLFAILAILEDLLVESTTPKALLFLPQFVLLGILSMPITVSEALRWSLLQVVYRLKLRKYMFSTRTSGVVFTLLHSRTEKAEVTEKVMNELLPTPNTRAWKKWKDIILRRIRDREDLVIGTTD